MLDWLARDARRWLSLAGLFGVSQEFREVQIAHDILDEVDQMRKRLLIGLALGPAQNQLSHCRLSLRERTFFRGAKDDTN